MQSIDLLTSRIAVHLCSVGPELHITITFFEVPGVSIRTLAACSVKIVMTATGRITLFRVSKCGPDSIGGMAEETPLLYGVLEDLAR